MMKSLRMALFSGALLVAAPAFAQDQTSAAREQPTSIPEATPAPAPAEAAPAPAPMEAAPAAAPQAAASTPAPAAQANVAPATLVVLDADGKVPAAPAGKGQVVFFRPAKLLGAALTFSVRENDDAVAKVGNGHYFVVVTDPGAHAYQMKGEVTDTLNMEIDAGETYYVETGIGVGIVAGRPHMTPSSEEAFEQISKKLKASKPVKQS